MDKGLLFAGAEPSMSTHRAINVLSLDEGLINAREASSCKFRRYVSSAFFLCTAVFFDGRILAIDTGTRVWKVPLPELAFLWVLTLSSSGMELEELLVSSEESSVYTMGATFDLPCLVNWFGSCTTKADALP